MNTSSLERVVARVNRNGEFYDEKTPIPLLTIPEFFDGNGVIGSIGCNLDGAPHPNQIAKVLRSIRERGDVLEVYIQVTEMDEPTWPFSDTAWVVTTASEDEIMGCFPTELAPDEVWVGFISDRTYEIIEIPEGSNVLACWWD